ncbi:MAG TPA: SH3 domain-containing protein [Verrucomicrobia bacterium]|nr:SH3 domain-containing protein [Verrucomicrobiota bacterium]
MKKWILMGCAALVASGAWAAKEMSVQVRDGQLRNRASFLGTVTGTVAYGDRVTVNQTMAGWCEVAKADGTTGWIHESALTPKRVVLSSGAADARTGASGEEVALAGKGFSKEVEAEYKKQNKDIDYTWVDWMGKQTVPSSQLVQFLKQGDLAQ